MSFNALANNSLLSQEKLIAQVESLFKQNTETLDYSAVVELSNKIINHRINYPSEIVAKTYLLLANVAINKGELETALQFTNDGLATATQNQRVKLPLQLNLAKIYSAKKEYQQLLTITQQAINIPQNKQNTRCFLIALSYRSVAFSMLGQHDKAFADLQQVETVIQENPAFSEHISLLTILANAYYHLEDYNTALKVQQKILKLRFNLKKLDNVDQTYYHLANLFYRLKRFDDAYTAYWEAKAYAINKNAPINIAYASQGLSLTLMNQAEFEKAHAEALQAKELFYKHNLATPYLESLIILSQIFHSLDKKEESFNLLRQAENLSANVKLTSDYIIYYQYLATMYFIKKDLNKAYFWQNKYSEALAEHLFFANKVNEFNSSPPSSLLNKPNKNIPASKKSKKLAIKLAEQSELTSSFASKFRKQQLIIVLLASIMSLLLFFIIIYWIKRRRQQLQTEYEALDKPAYLIANAVQTKQQYLASFNMARKYDYPLTLCFISITNWQELTFQFNKKTALEVRRGIACLINKQLSEFENAGLINEGEYLLSFPHQDKEQVAKTIERLVSALKLRFFANLGEFSIMIAYSIDSPDFKDIDPYVFLSQLSDSNKFEE